MEGTLQQCLNLGFPLVLAVCMLSMWGRGRMYSHPQHTMRRAALTGRFLTNIRNAGFSLHVEWRHILPKSRRAVLG